MTIAVKPLRPRVPDTCGGNSEQNTAPVALNDWLSGRNPFHLSTNSGTPLAAFQNWRNFKEAFGAFSE